MQNQSNSANCTASPSSTPLQTLYAGIRFSPISAADEMPADIAANNRRTLILLYCESGRIGWKTADGGYVYLGAGDFSVCSLNAFRSTRVTLPNGSCTGFCLLLDLDILNENPPPPLREAGVTGDALYKKLCTPDSLLPYAGTARTDAIFPFFLHQPPQMQTAYQKIKALELLLYLYAADNLLRPDTEYPAAQIDCIRQMHAYLLENLDKRITIDALSKRFLMNPTTIKAVFKSVYGMSIAAHIKAHRMEKAAALLTETPMRIAEVALAVGYDSPSKFTAAFKSEYGVLPTEYRKKRGAPTR